MNTDLTRSPLARLLARHDLPGGSQVEGHNLETLGRRLLLSRSTVRAMLQRGELVPLQARPDGVLMFDGNTLAAGRRAVLEEIVASVLAAKPNASEEELATLVAQAIYRQHQHAAREAQGTPDLSPPNDDEPDAEEKERNATWLGRTGQARQR